jgi:hypothetical protein
MNHLVVAYVKIISKGQTINLQQVYSGIYSQFPEQCQHLGLTSSNPIEKKWKNQIRYGLWEARKQGLIKHVGTQKSGLWQRI